jgi:hypothetical protein
MRLLCATLLSATMALGAAACSDSPASPSSTTSSSSSSPSSPTSPTSPTSPANNARLLVRFGAAPLAQAKAVLMTFSRIRIYRGSPNDYTDIPLSYTCDLNKMSSDAELVAASVPGAAYSQVSLTLQSVTVFIDNATAGAPCAASIPAPGGRSSALAVPAGEIAVPRNFDVRTGVETTMRLNFNTEQSIRVVGENSFSFTPSFSVVSVS